MIIVITGPTGVGKTKLSIELAKIYNAEIINADATQIYKGLDIGSAKVTEAEKENIPHHLLDIKEIDEAYSIYDYQKDCRKCIEEITSRGKNIIIVGGTGLYIKSALYDYTLNETSATNNQYEDKTTEELRVVRALNYYYATGKSINENKQGNKLLYDAIFIGLTLEKRSELYDRINNRVGKMIDSGLLEEVKAFYDKNVRTKPLLNAIGYKELYQYFDGHITYEDAVELIKRNSRRYAKRQYTFFNNQFNIKWFNSNLNNFDETIKEVKKYIKESE